MEAKEPEPAVPAPAPAGSWQAWIRPAAPSLANVKIRIPRFCYVDTLAFIGLIGLAWCLYLPGLQFGFSTLDDSRYMLVNRQIDKTTKQKTLCRDSIPLFHRPCIHQ